MRLPSKDVRELGPLLRDLGYTLARCSSGHPVYTHDDQPDLTLAGTPSDRRWLANVMAELRRRHPDHASLQRVAKSGVGRRRRHRARASRLPLSLVVAASEPEPEPAPIFERPERTSCIDCGRLWLSDLDFTSRPCPDCGGRIVAGTETA